MLEENAQPRSPFTYYARLRRVRDYVCAHLNEDLSLTRAAKVAGLERSYFSYFFRERTGVAYHEWVASVRVDRAQALIRSSNKSLSSIAFAVGFGSVRTFERAFKKQTGMSAMSYKKSVRPK